MIVSKQYGGWGMGDLGSPPKNWNPHGVLNVSPSDRLRVEAAQQKVASARIAATADLNPAFYAKPDPGAVDAAVANLKKQQNTVAAKYAGGAFGITKAQALTPVAAAAAPTAAPMYRSFDAGTSAAVKTAAAQVLATPIGMPFAKPSAAVTQAALAVTASTAADQAMTTSPSSGGSTGGGGGGGGGGDQTPADQGTDDGAPVSWWDGLSTTMKVAVVGGGAVTAFIAYKMIRKHR